MEVVAVDPHGGGDRGPQEITPDAERGQRGLPRPSTRTSSAAGPRPACGTCGWASEDALAELDGPDRPALRRRRPPLRAGARRHRALRRARDPGRHAADPRHLQRRRRDARPAAAAVPVSRSGATSGARARWRSTAAQSCRARRLRATPSARRPGSPGSCATARSRWRSWRGCRGWPGAWACPTAMPGPTSAAASRAGGGDGARDDIAAAPARCDGAALYLLSSSLMFAPGLAPGRTLSASDYLWSSTPWETSRPGRGARRSARTASRPTRSSCSSRSLQHTRAALPDIPLWNPYIMGGRPFHANSQSATLSPFSVPAYVLPFWDSLAVMAALKLFVAALRGLPARPAVRHALRRRAAVRARVRLQPLVGHLGVVDDDERLGAAALALPAGGAVRAAARAARRSPGWPRSSGCSSSAVTPSSSFQVMVAVTLFWVVRASPSRATARARPGLLRLLTLGRGTGRHRAGGGDADPVRRAARALDRPARRARRRARRQLTSRRATCSGVFLHDWWGRGSRAPLEFASALEEHA